jgi:hypothetical protein
MLAGSNNRLRRHWTSTVYRLLPRALLIRSPGSGGFIFGHAPAKAEADDQRVQFFSCHLFLLPEVRALAVRGSAIYQVALHSGTSLI